MSKNSIKCLNCDEWNDTSKTGTDQRCKMCGCPLDLSGDINAGDNDQEHFMDGLPPYAKYVFIGLVSIIGGIVVFVLA